MVQEAEVVVVVAVVVVVVKVVVVVVVVPETLMILFLTNTAWLTEGVRYHRINYPMIR